MDKREYVKLFERKLVHHCTPTLAGIKPGSLFVCRDESVSGLGKSESGIVSARTHERNLAYALHATRDKLYDCGVRIELWHAGKSGCFSMSTAPTCFDATFRAPRCRASSHRGDATPAPSRPASSFCTSASAGPTCKARFQGLARSLTRSASFWDTRLRTSWGSSRTRARTTCAADAGRCTHASRMQRSASANTRNARRLRRALRRGSVAECLAILDDAFPADEAYSQAS